MTPLRLRSSLFSTAIRSCMDRCRPASIRNFFSYWQLMKPVCYLLIRLNRYFDSCFLNYLRILRMLNSLLTLIYRIRRMRSYASQPKAEWLCPEESLSSARTISQNQARDSHGQEDWPYRQIISQNYLGVSYNDPPSLTQNSQRSYALITPLWFRSIILNSRRKSILCCETLALRVYSSLAVGRKTSMNLRSNSLGEELRTYSFGFSMKQLSEGWNLWEERLSSLQQVSQNCLLVYRCRVFISFYLKHCLFCCLPLFPPSFSCKLWASYSYSSSLYDFSLKSSSSSSFIGDLCLGSQYCFSFPTLFLLGLGLGLINFYSISRGNEPFLMPSLRLRYRKWESSTLTKAFMKFLSQRLVILVSSLRQWLGCLSPAFLIDSKTFLSLSLGIFRRLSPFCTSSFRINDICSVSSIKNPVTVDSCTPYFSSLGYLLR